MERTENFRRQHKELLQITTDLSSLLREEQLRKNASEARGVLSMLAGKLKIYLTMEDDVLYPSPTAIQNNPADFIEDSKCIFEALTKRIEKEENKLYSLVDSL